MRTRKLRRPCNKCGKMFQPTGKFSKLCEKCLDKSKIEKRKKYLASINKEKCCICGERCSGKMRITARKNKEYIFCTFHFSMYLKMPIEEVRKAIKINKKLLK